MRAVLPALFVLALGCGPPEGPTDVGPTGTDAAAQVDGGGFEGAFNPAYVLVDGPPNDVGGTPYVDVVLSTSALLSCALFMWCELPDSTNLTLSVPAQVGSYLVEPDPLDFSAGEVEARLIVVGTDGSETSYRPVAGTVDVSAYVDGTTMALSYTIDFGSPVTGSVTVSTFCP